MLKFYKLRVILRSIFLHLCCLTSGRVAIEISYSDQKGESTSRIIRPLYPKREKSISIYGRVYFNGPLKFVAWCEKRRAERQFFSNQMKILGISWYR